MGQDKKEHGDKHERRSFREKRRAIEKALDGVAKTAREVAEKRARERAPELFGGDKGHKHGD